VPKVVVVLLSLLAERRVETPSGAEAGHGEKDVTLLVDQPRLTFRVDSHLGVSEQAAGAAEGGERLNPTGVGQSEGVIDDHVFAPFRVVQGRPPAGRWTAGALPAAGGAGARSAKRYFRWRKSRGIAPRVPPSFALSRTRSTRSTSAAWSACRSGSTPKAQW